MEFTKMERKAIKLLLKKDTVSKTELKSLLGDKYYDDVMNNLRKNNLIDQIRIGVDPGGFPIFKQEFKIHNRNKCRGILEDYFNCVQRFWIPVVISAVALLLSIVSIILQYCK